MESVKLNLLSKLFCALMLVFGFVLISCEDGVLGSGEDTEQGENGNGDIGKDDSDGGGSDDGTGETNDAITNNSGGVTLTVKLRNLTETGVDFYGMIKLAEIYLTNSFGILYSEKETFNAETALGYIPIVDIYGTNYSVSTSSLKPATTYYYTSYIKLGDVYTYGEIKSFTTASLVAPRLNDATDITEVSATICGIVSPASGTASDLEYGFQYSTSSDFSSDVTSKKITDINSENKFSLSIASLIPGTAHYYRSYVKMNGVYDYCEIKSFTTASLVAPRLNDATDITEVSATICGIVSPASGTASDLEYGFQYSTSSDFSSDVTSKKITDINSENKFSYPITSLILGTVHYYRSYIKMNGVYDYGEIKSFTTKKIIPVVPSGYANLSAATTANCYIVSQSGSYCFLVAKGNQPSNLLHFTKSASLLWESFGTSKTPSVGALIKVVSYADGYVTFSTADTFREGNAVIAVKDADGNILWSWHIWLTDQPVEQEYYNNAGTMMDRNLGATSASPGDVGALGLLYQWGRKDPFLGSSSIWSRITAKSTITWPSAVSADSQKGTVEYANANPTTFIKYNKPNPVPTSWQSSKTIYDPCPPGWRVPDGGENGVWSKAIGSSSDFWGYPYDSNNSGMDFSGKLGSASTIWYPASGFLYYDGDLINVDYEGRYWSATPCNDDAYSLYINEKGHVMPSYNDSRLYGLSVRCLQE